MIVADPNAFPNCVVDLLHTTLAGIDPEVEMHKRPLRID